MFKGEYSHAIDTKGRLIIPAKIREELGDSCVVAKSFDNCLSIYTQEAFQEITAKLSNAPSNKSQVRAVMRHILGSAADLEFDKQGRILIPAALRSYAMLKKDAVIVGVGSKVEVWSREKWDAYTDVVADNIEEMAEELDLGGMGL